MNELRREGLSIRGISELTGYDRKTIRKYLLAPVARPVYRARPAGVSKLEAFKPYLEQRLLELNRRVMPEGFEFSYELVPFNEQRLPWQVRRRARRIPSYAIKSGVQLAEPLHAISPKGRQSYRRFR